MRISWLSADEIATARGALTTGGKSWDDHFASGEFAGVAQPAGASVDDWAHVTEHVARAERVSQVVRDYGFEEALSRFAGSGIAIEAATLAAAAYAGEVLDLDRVIGVLGCEIDSLVFYAPFLELMIGLGKDQIDRTVETYEEFVGRYANAIVTAPRGIERIGAMRDGLADYYVSAGRFDDAESLFETRHEEDRGDVAVALSASRAFLAAGSVSHAVRWLGVGAERAIKLGKGDLATKLLEKQGRVRERLS
jgi:hypothetical protein